MMQWRENVCPLKDDSIISSQMRRQIHVPRNRSTYDILLTRPIDFDFKLAQLRINISE